MTHTRDPEATRPTSSLPHSEARPRPRAGPAPRPTVPTEPARSGSLVQHRQTTLSRPRVLRHIGAGLVPAPRCLQHQARVPSFSTPRARRRGRCESGRHRRVRQPQELLMVRPRGRLRDRRSPPLALAPPASGPVPATRTCVLDETRPATARPRTVDPSIGRTYGRGQKPRLRATFGHPRLLVTPSEGGGRRARPTFTSPGPSRGPGLVGGPSSPRSPFQRPQPTSTALGVTGRRVSLRVVPRGHLRSARDRSTTFRSRVRRCPGPAVGGKGRRFRGTGAGGRATRGLRPAASAATAWKQWTQPSGLTPRDAQHRRAGSPGGWRRSEGNTTASDHRRFATGAGLDQVFAPPSRWS